MNQRDRIRGGRLMLVQPAQREIEHRAWPIECAILARKLGEFR